MKKIILMSLVLVTLFACDKQEFQTPEKQEIEEFKEKYRLQTVQNKENYTQFETLAEAEKFIKALKSKKGTIKNIPLERKGDHYSIESKTIKLTGSRLKSAMDEDVYGTIDAGMFSSFRVDFQRAWVDSKFIINPSSIKVSVTGVPVLWAGNQGNVSMHTNTPTNAHISVRGIISWGISVGGQGLLYNEAARIQYYVAYSPASISGSITKE